MNNMCEKWMFYSKGKPVFPLGLQAANSSGFTKQEFAPNWDAAKNIYANTLVVPVYWENVEPEEGKYDFSCIDFILEGARENGFYVIPLWFASWKNGSMKNAPVWVKKNPQKYHRVINSDGLPISVLSAHCEANRDADARAFAAMLGYIKEHDSEQSIIAVQVENEPGIGCRTVYDHGPEGQADLEAQVPAEVFKVLEAAEKGSAYECWLAHGKKTKGNWIEIFGVRGADLMEVYYLSGYIDAVCAAGKAVYDIPMFLNVWLDKKQWDRPGIEYLSGSCCTRNYELFHGLLKHIDFVAPDPHVYPEAMFNFFCETYSNSENALFMPEVHGNMPQALNTMNAIGEYGLQGLAYSLWYIAEAAANQIPEDEMPGAENFRFLRTALPLLIKYHATGRIHAVVQREYEKEKQLKLQNYRALVTFDSHPENLGKFGKTAGQWTDWHNRDYEQNPTRARGLIIEGDDGYLYVVGTGFRAMFRDNIEEGIPSYMKYYEERDMGFYSVSEGYMDDEYVWHHQRTRSGDESDYGIWVTPRCGCVRVELEPHNCLKTT